VSDDPLAAGLAALLQQVVAIPDDLERMKRADTAVEMLRQAESILCSIRDGAIRADRLKQPDRSVSKLVMLTGINRATITNARRLTRPVRYRYDDVVPRVMPDWLPAGSGAADPRAETD
jgi:hypothetical protein